jgi:hypothetical protein
VAKVTDGFVTKHRRTDPTTMAAERPLGTPKTTHDPSEWLARNLGVLANLDQALLAHLDL